ncbi:hypothetical protein TNCV_3395031 [Trichonephila clavipes]|nr:hypothetical protein TNCV_3395031 [Trichonephila clavipes]
MPLEPMGRCLTLLVGLQILAGHNGMAFTSWVTLPGVKLPTYLTHSAQEHPITTMRQTTGFEGMGHNNYILIHLKFTVLMLLSVDTVQNSQFFEKYVRE